MNTEKWDYKLNGKNGGKVGIVIFLVLDIFFIVLTVDQLKNEPGKYVHIAYSFGATALMLTFAVVMVVIRHFCFRVYIGKQGFYFQTNPFNGRYYLYSEIQSCEEKLKVYDNRRRSATYYYYFIFTDKQGKTKKFLFEKYLYEHEIEILKERIEKAI